MIIPVIDLMNGKCVSGKSGNRNTYTKLKSIYGDNPISIAQNLKNDGAQLIYVADLDKIENKGDNTELISQINNILPVLLDNGISNLSDINNKNICTYYILATETMESIDDAINIFKNIDNKKLVISVDIKNNELLLRNKSIKLDDIIRLITEVNPQYIILLNISQVGTKKQNENLIIKKIIQETPNTKHILGGGITNEAIQKYKLEGIENFLIGTVLHEGNLKYKL